MLRSLRVFLSIAVMGISLAGSVWAACPDGDLTDDCRVDFNDVKFMADRWLAPPGSPADIFGGDGVNWGDFAVLANNWGAVGDATGSLRVSISPLEVIVDGAQWRVDGGLWRDNGTTASDLTVGPHTVDFVDVPGWTKPGSKVVQISEGGLIDIAGTYTRQLGSLRVDVGPAAAVAAGAQWRVDGGSWRGSGATANNLYAGSHTVEFKEVGGWVSAALRTVIVNQGLTTSITGTYSQPLVISEFLASNRSRPPLEEGDLLDEDGASSDWIEIYNPTDIPIDIGGWYLTNSDSNLAEWQFPAGVTLESGEFLVVFASNKNRRDPNNPLHTNFELDRDPMYLALVGRDGFSVVHAYSPEYPDQLPDVSYGLAQGATKLLGEGGTARYHVPTSADAGASWTAVDFADAAWQTGKTSIGFGNLTVSSGVNYEYYEGYWDWLPDFDSLTPVSKGMVEDFDITHRNQNDYFGFRFTGSIEISTAGTYTFYTNSDDGSQLFIDGGLVVNNDGPHSAQEMSGSIYLTVGMHPIVVTFFEQAGGEALIVSYSGPGISKTQIPGSVLWIGPATDVEAQMKTVNASLWVRMEFNLEEGEAATFDTLTLRMKYEDGYAAYLNGQPVGQDNAPSPLNWNSAALSDRPIENSATFTSTNLMPYLSHLRVGRNVLAIHALNDNKNNGEFLILPELVSTTEEEAYQYFTLRTPGKYNVTGALGATSEVWFSHERGFYSSPFNLTLSTETYGAEIRYTKDGSTPTASHGDVYAAGSPIRIDKTTALRAVAVMPGCLDSEVMTHTYIFVSDVIRQSPTGELPGTGWPANGAVNGQAMDYGMDPDVVNSSTWGSLVDDGLLAIPSISLVTDVENLFDPVRGIYVNPGGHGRNWECPASAELINPDGSDGFHINAGLRIRGGYSRGTWNPKHAFRLFFRSEYGEANLQFPLFEDEGVKEFDKVDLATSQNYSWSHGGSSQNTMVRDVWSRDMQGAMGHPYTRTRYYHLYVNGVYWGLYNTQERAESVHAAAYMGGEREDYDVMKADWEVGRQMNAIDGNTAAFDRLYNETMAGLGSMERYYRLQGMNLDGARNPAYERLLDVEGLIDFMIIEYYTGDRDGPGSRYGNIPNNTYGAYNRVNPDGWKWYHHDNEHTLGAGSAELNMVTPFTTAGASINYFNPHWLHEQLANSNIDYRVKFADHVYKHFFNGGLLTVEKAREYIQTRASQINMAIIAESARWGDAQRHPPFTKQDWANEINWLLTNTSDGRVLTQRVGVVLQQLRDVGWYPYVNPPTLSHPGGEVPKGQTLTMSASSGKIYYTTDGTDPRLPVAQSGGGGTVTLVREDAAKRVLVPTGPVTSTTGSIQYEYWMGIGGGAVWNLTSHPDFPGNPHGTSSLTMFEAPTDWAEDYGARISGYVHPPQTGNYRFWICSDDNSELWLSSDENPANATRIAFEDSWAPSRNWQNGNERSAYIGLQAGRKYYIEALMAEGWGGDNLAVTWSGPGVTYGVPIIGTYLSPPALPDTWATLNYNHSSWRSGTGGVGYERNPGDPVNYVDLIATDVQTDMYNKNRTCYIRIPFTVGTLDLLTLRLKVRYDDGFVAYINGSKVASGNFTGTPQWDSGADSDRADSAAREFVSIDISEHIDKLRAGNNILAVQGLNYTKGSSDFLISAELTATQMGQGDVSPGATQYTSPITINKSTVVKARVLDGVWSPLREATYAVGPVADSLRITEIMYHPQETGDPEDPNEEFIELRNIGPSAINLNLVRFTNGIDFTFGDIDLGTGEEGYVVVVAKRSAFEARYPGSSDVIAGEYTGRLDNAGERIRLEDAIGRTIHDFEYKDGWRSITDGEGFSLTIIDPTGAASSMPDNGLVAYWRLDDGAGATAIDSAGTNNGTVHGNPVWTAGRIGGALSLDGDGDYVSLSPVGALTGNNVTVSMWINMSELGGAWNPILTQSNLSGDGYYLYTWGGEPTFSVVSGGAAASASSSESIDWNEWHQLAGTNDGSNLRLYVDGVPKGSGSSAGKTGVSDSAYIGYSSSVYYCGVLDDVRIYNRALSEYEFAGGGDPLERWGEKDSWRASAYVGGSPGWDDSGIIPNPGAIVINELLAHSHAVAADWIELYNTTNAQVNIGGWYLSDSAADLKKYRIADGKKINAYGYVVFREDSNFGEFSSDPGKITAFALSENGDELYLSSAQGGVLTGYREAESFGASYTGVSFGRYFKRSTGNYNFVSMDHITPGWANAYPKVGPIVINEIMYNPQSGDQKEEFVELRNIGPADVTLYDFNEAKPWRFTDGIDYTFPGYPGVITVPAGWYVLLVPDVGAYEAKYGAPPADVILLDAYDGKLSNSGERLELSMPGDIDEFGMRHYIRADRVDYSDGSHPENEPGGIDLWPTGPDGGGASLRRVTGGLYGNDPNNWTVSSPPTPGR